MTWFEPKDLFKHSCEWVESRLSKKIKKPRYWNEVMDFEKPTSPKYLKNLITLRLRIPEGSFMPFAFLECYKRDETVFVFVVNSGDPVILEDGWDLFPSDKLITKLRILKETRE